MLPMIRIITLSIAALSLLCTNGSAQSLDPSFGTNGHIPSGGPLSNGQSNKGVGYNTALQPDGKLVVSMDKYDPNSTDWYFYTYRYNTDGTPDTTFGDNGVSRLFVGDQCKNLDLQLHPDGRIAVIGRSEYCINGVCGAPQFIMMRLMPDGSLDTSFGDQGHLISSDVFGNQGTFAIANRVRLLANGKYIIGGRGINNRPFVARLNANGYPDPSFATNGLYSDTTRFNMFIDLMVDEAQNSFALVQIFHYLSNPPVGSVTDTYIIKLGPNGQPDASFGDNGISILDLGGDEEPTSMAMLPNGQLVVTTTDRIAFVTSNGDLVNGGSNAIHTIEIPGEGEMFVDKVVVVGADRLLLCGKVHQIELGNYLEKAFVAQVDGQGQLRPDFNGTGYMMLDLGINATTGWNGKLCRLYDLDIAPDGAVFGTGYRNPVAGNTYRSLLLLKILGIPLGEVNVSVDEASIDPELLLFPNPTSGLVQLSLSEAVRYSVYNTAGALVTEGRFNAGQNTLDLGAQAPGQYLLILRDASGLQREASWVVRE